MSVMNFQNNPFNPFAAQLFGYIIHNQRNPHLGDTRRAGEEKRTAYTQGLEALLGEIIAAEINRRRGNFLHMQEKFSAVNAFDREVLGLTKTVQNIYTQAAQNKQAGENVMEVFYDRVSQRIDQLAVTAEIKAEEAERHRAAVLAGTEDPYESDMAWLEEIYKEAALAEDRIRKLMNRISVAPLRSPVMKAPRTGTMVPQQRIIKDTPQASGEESDNDNEGGGEKDFGISSD